MENVWCWIVIQCDAWLVVRSNQKGSLSLRDQCVLWMWAVLWVLRRPSFYMLACQCGNCHFVALFVSMFLFHWIGFQYFRSWSCTFLHFLHFCVTLAHVCVTCVNLQMSAFCAFVSLVCTSLHFCAACLHFSAIQILLMLKSEGTSTLFFFVPKKCTNKI